MRILKRLAGFLGLARDEAKDQEEGQEHQQPEPGSHDRHNRTARPNYQETGVPRRGFSVQVAVDRPDLPPLLSPCPASDGGVQGLRWYAKRLRIDRDGDVADEFLEEVMPETASSVDDPNKSCQRFRVNYSTRPVKIKKQVISDEGKILHCL